MPLKWFLTASLKICQSHIKVANQTSNMSEAKRCAKICLDVTFFILQKKSFLSLKKYKKDKIFIIPSKLTTKS